MPFLRVTDPDDVFGMYTQDATFAGINTPDNENPITLEVHELRGDFCDYCTVDPWGSYEDALSDALAAGVGAGCVVVWHDGAEAVPVGGRIYCATEYGQTWELHDDERDAAQRIRDTVYANTCDHCRSDDDDDDAADDDAADDAADDDAADDDAADDDEPCACGECFECNPNPEPAAYMGTRVHPADVVAAFLAMPGIVVNPDTYLSAEIIRGDPETGAAWTVDDLCGGVATGGACGIGAYALYSMSEDDRERLRLVGDMPYVPQTFCADVAGVGPAYRAGYDVGFACASLGDFEERRGEHWPQLAGNLWYQYSPSGERSDAVARGAVLMGYCDGLRARLALTFSARPGSLSWEQVDDVTRWLADLGDEYAWLNPCHPYAY